MCQERFGGRLMCPADSKGHCEGPLDGQRLLVACAGSYPAPSALAQEDRCQMGRKWRRKALESLKTDSEMAGAAGGGRPPAAQVGWREPFPLAVAGERRSLEPRSPSMFSP